MVFSACSGGISPFSAWVPNRPSRSATWTQFFEVTSATEFSDA
jgi:hypothetical protein